MASEGWHPEAEKGGWIGLRQYDEMGFLFLLPSKQFCWLFHLM